MAEPADTTPAVDIPPRIAWQIGTVQSITVETYRTKTFTISLPKWVPFRPGQHYDVRLTAPDGYQAQRSYSIASAPEFKGRIDLTVELMPDGEVSPYFHEVVVPGDRIELRGPIGGPFTWTPESGGPLLLIGGGSGVVPLMSMLRHRAVAAPYVESLLLYSVRSHWDIIYRLELDRMGRDGNGFQLMYTFTREPPDGWDGYSRRVDEKMLADAVDRLGAVGRAYICGPDGFVETAANGLVAIGISPERIRTERFGPSGEGVIPR